MVGELDSAAQQPRVALVTGAGGFVGRHMIATLLRSTAWSVVGVARQPAEPASPRCRFVAADLTSAEQMRQLVEEIRPDVVFHLAAATPPKPDQELFAVNVGGVINLLEAVSAAAPEATVLVVGSDAQYGLQQPAHIPTTEAAPMLPVNAYGRSKVLQETIALQYRQMAGLRVICVRPFNHIGPGQSDRFVVARMAQQIANAEQGRGPTSIEMGRMDALRDFSDVRDVVHAYLLCVLHGEPGTVYNIGSGTARSIAEIGAILTAAARVPTEFRSVPGRVRHGEVTITQCDASLLRAHTGWTPTLTIEQTLNDILQDARTSVAAQAVT